MICFNEKSILLYFGKVYKFLESYKQKWVLLTKCGPYKTYAAGLKTPD